MKHDKTVVKTEHAAHAKVIYRRHLRGDVVVLKVFRHLSKLTPLSKTKYGRLVDVDDTLPTHAERETAVLVNDAVAREARFREPGCFCTIDNNNNASHLYCAQKFKTNSL